MGDYGAGTVIVLKEQHKQKADTGASLPLILLRFQQQVFTI